MCAAITAAREGIRVVLLQDRPVLGGNASSEVRLWVLGATSHMGNNNRWALEGGVIHEILTENLWRNPEGNPVLIDALLLDKVTSEEGITLLLNATVFEIEKESSALIKAVHAVCSQNSTRYKVQAPLFMDASGDGILGFLAGAAFRTGAEGRADFNEPYAPVESSSDLLGHSLYLMSKDVGYPVSFVAPGFAAGIEEIERIHRFRAFDFKTQACQFWWLEYGGRMDTIHDTESIKWELWRIAYGVWNYIKNSGKFPGSETMTLEWVGHIPGKRESRRFEGDIMLAQQDLIEQTAWPDAVSYGGWAIDHHPADGVYSELPGCTQWHSKGVYGIPFRALYSRTIENLFLAGRIISCSHIAFGSTRVMATCAHSAQAVGMAAAHCRRDSLLPRDLVQPERMRNLQSSLVLAGQYIPGFVLEDAKDLAREARISASSECQLSSLPQNGETAALEFSSAIMIPVQKGRLPVVTLYLDVARPTSLEIEARTSSKPGNHTPDVILAARKIELPAGVNLPVEMAFDAVSASEQYVFFCLMRNPDVEVRLSDSRLTGILSVSARFNKAVAVSSRQDPPPGIGVDAFEFWLPQRRPKGKNPALRIEPALECFGASNVVNGVGRPVTRPNAWVADPEDSRPSLNLSWDRPKLVRRIIVAFDADFDHPLESVIMGHPERVAPFCAKHFRIVDDSGRVLFEERDNHSPRREVVMENPLQTKAVGIEILEGRGAPGAVFEVHVFS